MIGAGGEPLIPDGPAVTIMEATELSESPRAYGAFMAYQLERLFRVMPEVGDLAKPELVLIIDEAHALFIGMNGPTLEAMTRVFRLIRSRGVAIFLATQNPADIPAPIAMQLGNRILHSMRPGDARLESYVKTLFLAPRDEGSNIELERARDLYSLRPGQAYAGTFDASGNLRPMRRLDVASPSIPFGCMPLLIPQSIPEIVDRMRTLAEIQAALDENPPRASVLSRIKCGLGLLGVSLTYFLASGAFGVYMFHFDRSQPLSVFDMFGAVLGVAFCSAVALLIVGVLVKVMRVKHG